MRLQCVKWTSGQGWLTWQGWSIFPDREQLGRELNARTASPTLSLLIGTKLLGDEAVTISRFNCQ